MIRKLLATTAMALVISGTAIAQEQQPAPATPAPATAETPAGTSIFSTEPGEPLQAQNGYFTAAAGQILATSLIGKTVYASAAADAESVGEVNDILMAPNGAAEAVVIGVGGFLGMGEKDVAIDFERLTWVGRDGQQWLTAQLTKEELEAAPAFNRADIVVGVAQPADGTAPAATAQTEQPAADPAQPADGTATAQTEQPAAGQQIPARDTLAEVDMGTMSADTLKGTRVYGADDKDLGEVGDVIVTTDGKVEAYIVDVGGFLGIGEKPVALDAAQLKVMKDNGGSLYLYTPFTEEALKNQTAYDKDAYPNDRDTYLLR